MDAPHENQRERRLPAQAPDIYNDLRAHDAALAAVSFAADRFLKVSDWQESISDVLSAFGEAVEASRVYLYKNQHVDGEGWRLVPRTTWHAPETKPRQHPPFTGVDSEPSDERVFWLDLLLQGEHVVGRPEDFDASTQRLLEQLDVQSTLMIPVFDEATWWGFLAFDHCREPAVWSSHDIHALKAGAGIIGAAIRRKHSEEKKAGLVANMRAVVEAADELLLCSDLDAVYRRAVELARETLGIERGAIKVQVGDNVVGTFGTNLKGETTDERADEVEVSDVWRQQFSPSVGRDFRWHVVHQARREWDGERSRELDEGWVVVTPIRSRDGKPMALFCNDAAITGSRLKLEQQEVLAVYCSLLGSIIQGRHAEAQLQQTEHDLRTLVEHLPAITYRVVIGNPSRTVYISPQVDGVLGYTSKEWVENPDLWRDVLHPEDRDWVVEETLKSNSTGVRSCLEYRAYTRDGQLKWFRNEAISLKDTSGEPYRAYGVMTDITEWKESVEREEELRENLARAKRLESLGLLAGGVAHDLNNILGPVLAYPDMVLSRVPEDEQVTHDLLAIKHSAHRAADVIQDLLALARRGNYQLESTDLNQLVNEQLHTSDTQAMRARRPDIHVEVELEHELPRMHGSGSHLLRVLTNLVNNAFEAMSGGGELTIRTHKEYLSRPLPGYEQMEEGMYVAVSVTDTGEGMNPEEQARAFEPFYSNRKAGSVGSGLGLAVVYGVVKDLHGYIRLESDEGVGTCFSLYFPASSAGSLAPHEEVKDFTGTERVLVVDDVEDQRQLASTLLRFAGYQVETASSGRMALERLQNETYDILVLDMIMEDDFDGLDTYREVVKLCPGQPCVIASGYAETARVKEARALGAGQFVRKPYTLEAIAIAVRAELNRARH